MTGVSRVHTASAMRCVSTQVNGRCVRLQGSHRVRCALWSCTSPWALRHSGTTADVFESLNYRVNLPLVRLQGSPGCVCAFGSCTGRKVLRHLSA